MARTVAEFPKGPRISDYLSLGVITKTVPLERVRATLEALGKTSRRQRELPAHVVVYYVILLALFMQVSYREVLRCLLEGLQWLLGPGVHVKVTGKSGISQARTRLGEEVLQRLHDELVRPIAPPGARGAWYRQWRLVSLDGSTMEVADTAENEQAFGRPGGGNGAGAYPQLRMVSLVENGTHVLFATQCGPYHTGEVTMAHTAVASLRPGMLCLADRLFFSYGLWKKAQASGADLLWRLKKDTLLERHQDLPDGSYLAWVYENATDRKHKRKGLLLRVVDYYLEGVEGSEPLYRLATTIVDPAQAPAQELAGLYHERWEIETALDELKTHLRGARMLLRSKTPELARQEFYGLLIAHYAVRGLMLEAALQIEEDPDRLSFVHAVRVVRRKLPRYVAIPPSAGNGPTSGGTG
jgi:hypothetical protein